MWHNLILPLWLAALAMPAGSTVPPSGKPVLPIEVLGPDGTTATQTIALSEAMSASAEFLWLQVHGVRYPEQASVQVNDSAWIPLRNETVIVDEPGAIFGGIGGGFSTLEVTVALVKGTIVAGNNTVRFRFNQSDGLSSGYRVLAWNFLTTEGRKLVPAGDFMEEQPEAWTPPLDDAASIQAGKQLWSGADLISSSLPHSPRIQAHCADCHALDGRDLKYFNYSNTSIVTRSEFHGLTELQGKQIASYIRSLPFPHPGRPWNPPYQPGPATDSQPISNWAAGAGLAWVLNRDVDALSFIFGGRGTGSIRTAADAHTLASQITPAFFRPDGDLNPREIPIALQLPDWSQWLPRVHPKDAWGKAFAASKFAVWYDGGTATGSKNKVRVKESLRTQLVAAEKGHGEMELAIQGFHRWSQSRQAFLGQFVKGNTIWSPELSKKVYSTQLWQLVKTWELMQEFALEGRGRAFFGPIAESRTWCNSVAAETAPAAAHIPNGPAGVGGKALTNEYLTASWYELQIVLNSGNHQHHDRQPVDWVYAIHEFRQLYEQTHEAEPARLLVAVTKALQSCDPHLGPADYDKGWRPEKNVDPRILVSAGWKAMFAPLPGEVRRALTQSMLSAWMDKNQQYPIAEYLPLPVPPHDSRYLYGDISGGKVWESAGEFRAAGVSADLVARLQNWGMAYTDRAARLQYH